MKETALLLCIIFICFVVSISIYAKQEHNEQVDRETEEQVKQYKDEFIGVVTGIEFGTLDFPSMHSSALITTNTGKRYALPHYIAIGDSIFKNENRKRYRIGIKIVRGDGRFRKEQQNEAIVLHE